MDAVTFVRAHWERVVGFTLIGLGAVALMLGFNGVSNSPYVAEELSYIISGGIGGMFLLGCGATMLISADIHDEWRKLDRIEAAIRGEAPVESEATSEFSGSSPGMNGDDRRRALALLAVGSAADGGGAVPAERRRDATAVAATASVAAAALVGLGWHGASSVSDPAKAVNGVIVAVAGLALALVAGFGGTLWLKRGVRLRQMRLFGPLALSHMAAAAAGAKVAPVEHSDAGAVSERVLVAPGRTRYHRSGCPALVGLKARQIDRSKLKPGMLPCGICDVDE